MSGEQLQTTRSSAKQMPAHLVLTIGQYSDKGRKQSNQDFHGVQEADRGGVNLKGVAIALADGVSHSDVSHIASETAVKSFLEDYFCTSDAWSVRKSAHQVLMATNAWLHAQTRNSQYRYQQDKGYVCTFSALILKAGTAHIFHCGDSRICRIREGSLEPLTQEHRVWVSPDESYLSRAMGFNDHLELDYDAVPIQPGDIFVLMTDGVHEYVDVAAILSILARAGDSLDVAAQQLAGLASDRGSPDNLTCQIVRVDAVPLESAYELTQRAKELSFAPALAPGAELDGYEVVDDIRITNRSHLHRVIDQKTGETFVMKLPSLELREDSAALERFFMEEWVARRVDSPYVLKSPRARRSRNYHYALFEFIDGQTLSRWMLENPKPELKTVRMLCGQIAQGLRAMHRLEMLHQDLRPENIMIDAHGQVRIIDLGATRVRGIAETHAEKDCDGALGTVQYMAPEVLLGRGSSVGSEVFALGVISYQMLCGRLPYGADAARVRSSSAQRALRYRSLLGDCPDVPVWVDETLRKAVHPNPEMRYRDPAEFMHDLCTPNPRFLSKRREPIIERSPVVFWQSVSAALALVVVWLLWLLHN